MKGKLKPLEAAAEGLRSARRSEAMRSDGKAQRGVAARSGRGLLDVQILRSFVWAGEEESSEPRIVSRHVMCHWSLSRPCLASSASGLRTTCWPASLTHSSHRQDAGEISVQLHGNCAVFPGSHPVSPRVFEPRSR